ncbi:MAG: protease modulator HflK [Candidatus Omnitrophica bacterium]|nr:protease modulator HflK [Candidatus Omnitrophota bacterium]
MDRNIQKIGLLNLLVLLVAGSAVAAVSRYANSATGQSGALFLGFGLLVAMVSYFQARLEHRERLEKLEFDELKKGPSSAALFTEEAETFPARRSREQFERFFVPGFTVLLLISQGLAVYWLWRQKANLTSPIVDRATITMALLGLFALVFFLLGKYSSGIARLERQRLLRPAASYLLMGALVCLLAAAAEVVAWFGFPGIDLDGAYVFGGLLVLVALENLINLILEIYRPRLKGQEVRLLYESRLIGLLSQPGGLITTVAQALDYQFGFKVSETWFYQFMEKALAWLILLQLGVLFLSTTVVIVGPNEEAVWERFGRPVQSHAVLEPGFHFKWPWPIDKVYRYPTRELQTFSVGFVPDPALAQAKTVLWTVPHTKVEFNMLVASQMGPSGNAADARPGEQAVPVNLLSVNIPVQYRIKDVRAWAYNHIDPAQLLEDIANREVVRYLVNVDIDDLMAPGRMRAAEALRRRIQTQSDDYQLGVEIVFVGLQGIHPPVEVAPAYEDVVGSMQEKETNILAALAYQARRIPTAEAEATNLLSRQSSDAYSKITQAEAKGAQFTNQLAAYNASPSVYKTRTYLESLVRAIGPARKFVLTATNTQDIFWLNLEDKLRPDLLDINVPTGKK